MDCTFYVTTIQFNLKGNNFKIKPTYSWTPTFIQNYR